MVEANIYYSNKEVVVDIRAMNNARLHKISQFANWNIAIACIDIENQCSCSYWLRNYVEYSTINQWFYTFELLNIQRGKNEEMKKKKLLGETNQKIMIKPDFLGFSENILKLPSQFFFLIIFNKQKVF